MKNCIACGMPMKETKDFAQSDPTLDYCRFCARPDGSMQNYDEKLKSITAFIVNSQGIDEGAARKAAVSMMAGLPAWNDQIR